MAGIAKQEFVERIRRVQEEMGRRNLDAVAVYGDEYRKESLRYVSNFWPIFERGACCFMPQQGDPILAGAPEGERYAREMCVWERRPQRQGVRLRLGARGDRLSPGHRSPRFAEILGDALGGGRRLGLVGLWDIPAPLCERLREAPGGMEIVDAATISCSACA